MLARCPHYIRHANFRGLAPDGAVLVGPWGGVLTVPPELRRFLATWHDHRKPLASDRTAPLFPGDTPGRPRPATIQRRLARLDAPASLWHDPPDTTIGEDANADGRALLLRLSAWHLWLEHDGLAPLSAPERAPPVPLDLHEPCQLTCARQDARRRLRCYHAWSNEFSSMK